MQGGQQPWSPTPRQQATIQQLKGLVTAIPGMDDWVEVQAPGAPMPYYYDFATRESTWHHPATSGSAGPGWQEAVDPHTGSIYMYNRATGQSLWK
eukprot:gene6697-8017_t